MPNEQVIEDLIEAPWKFKSEKKISQPIYSGLSDITDTIMCIPYTDQTGQELTYEIEECRCCPSLSRLEPTTDPQDPNLKDLRTELENKVFMDIKKLDPNQNNIITIGCVGKDYFAIIRLLAKLYKDGYRKFNILSFINSSKAGDIFIENTLINVMRIGVWKSLFPSATISYKVATINSLSKSYPKIQTPITNIFLLIEDLGSIQNSDFYFVNVNSIIDNIEKFLTTSEYAKSNLQFITTPNIHSYYISKPKSKYWQEVLYLQINERHAASNDCIATSSRELIFSSEVRIPATTTPMLPIAPMTLIAPSSSSSSSSNSGNSSYSITTADEALARRKIQQEDQDRALALQLQEETDEDLAKLMQKEEQDRNGSKSKLFNYMS